MFETVCSLLDASIARGECSCAALAIGVRAQKLLVYCAGTLFRGGPAANLHTRYDLASLTKIFAPTLLTLLAFEEGRMGLFDPLSLYLPVPDDKKEITLFHLMTHTSGIIPTLRLNQVHIRREDALNFILQYPLIDSVGNEVHYSCLGYILLGFALEEAYGMPLHTLARARVFEPLHLHHTSYTPSGTNFAATEIDPTTGVYLSGIVHDENARFLSGVSGNAGVFSDIGDCSRLCEMLCENGRTPEGYFLSPAAISAATRCYTRGKSDVRGLGFQLPSDGGVSMFGDFFPRDSYGDRKSVV